MKRTLTLLLLTIMFTSNAQKVIPLYNGKVPGSNDCLRQEYQGDKGRIGNVVTPTLTVFIPQKQDSLFSAVIICPGGGYSRLAFEHEGIDVAKALNEKGIAAFVLKYRLPNDSCMQNKETGPLQDAQEALKVIRLHAKEWNINPARVGVMGFSAGGHLASTLGTHFNTAVIENKENISLRPDFMILVYPVISFTDSLMHKGSREKLIGVNASNEKVNLYSNELQVTPQTPPTFLIHAEDDKSVPVNNSIFFYQALIKNKVLGELHVYPKGGHGFGMNNLTTKDKWFDRAVEWLREIGF